MRSRASAVGMAIGADGKALPPPAPTPSVVQKAISAASGDALDALEHFARADNWTDLWKAFEAIGAYYGSDDDATFKKLGASANAIKDFRYTANTYHRHHLSKHKPPKRSTAAIRNRLSFEEGRDFVGGLIRHMFA